MIEKILDPILAPFRQAWAKFMGIKNIADQAKGDVRRVKNMAGDVKKRAEDAKKAAKELHDKAKGAHDKAKGAVGQAQEYAGQAQGYVGQAQGAMGGGAGGAAQGGAPQRPGPPGAPNLPPGMPQPGMPPGMPMGMPQGMQPMGPGMGQPMGMRPPGMGQMPPMGQPMQPMGMNPMPYSAPGPGVRTMAIMAGGTAGATIGWLVPIKGPSRGELITLKPQSVIGKDPNCDVVFNDPFMSSRHATIRAQNGLFVLEDHSTNGTWVNDRKIQRHELVDNDFVKFGQTMVKFKAL